MTDQPKPNAENHDEELATFTDSLLDGKTDVAHTTSPDSTLQSLEATVLRINATLGDASPPTDMARRIRANLEKEWQQSDMKQPSLISRLVSSLSGNSGWQSRRQRRTFTAGIAVAVLAAFALVFTFALSGGTSGSGLEGTAQGQFPLAILLPVVALLGGLLWWASRRDS